MPPEDVKKERRDSEHKGKRRKEGTVQELKGNVTWDEVIQIEFYMVN